MGKSNQKLPAKIRYTKFITKNAICSMSDHRKSRKINKFEKIKL